MAHTLLFVQTKKGEHTKTYAEFESVNECIEGVCKIFEEHLKRKLNSKAKYISYNIKELFEFVDGVTDMSCLVFNSTTGTYAPFGKSWIKEKIYKEIKSKVKRRKEHSKV